MTHSWGVGSRREGAEEDLGRVDEVAKLATAGFGSKDVWEVWEVGVGAEKSSTCIFE